jgi:hypothetical protein
MRPNELTLRGLILGTLITTAFTAAVPCHHARHQTTPLVALAEEYCWWAVLRTPLPTDTVAARFERAFARGDSTHFRHFLALGPAPGSALRDRVKGGDSTRRVLIYPGAEHLLNQPCGGMVPAAKSQHPHARRRGQHWQMPPPTPSLCDRRRFGRLALRRSRPLPSLSLSCAT